ncbi:MAG: DUF748 domain-containing protein [Myxococcales bacterium]
MGTLAESFRRRPPRWAIVVVGLVGLYAISGFLVLPAIVRSQMEKRLPAVLHRAVTVREVRFNPFAISMTIRGFSVKERDGSTLLGFEELYVDVALLRHLRGGVHLEEVRVVRPEVRVAVLKGGKLNFSDLLENGEREQPAEPKPAEGKPTIFEIAHFSLDRGAIAFADRNRRRPFEGRIEPLSFALDGFTTEPQKNGAYHFEAKLEPATQLAWTGTISAIPPKSAGELSITGIQLAQFVSYAEDSTTLRITAGTMDLRGRYLFDASRTPTAIKLEEGSLSLNGLRLDHPDRDDELVRLESLALDGISADVGEAEARVRSIALLGAHLIVRRLSDGRIELSHLSRPRVLPKPSGAPPSRPWTTRVDGIHVERLGLVWEDHVPATPARVEIGDLQLNLSPLLLPGGVTSTFSTSFRIGPDGHFSAQGTANAASGAADVQLELTKLDLSMFQPYAAQSITGSLARGELEVKGRASWSVAPDGTQRPRFDGDIAVANLSLLDGTGKPLAGFERFALEKLQTDTVETRLRRVLLKGGRLHGRIAPDGIANWATLSREPAKQETPPAKPETARVARKAEGPKVSIEAIALEDFALDFTDRSLKPPFVTRLTRFGGQIAPFTQPGLAKSKIDLSGKLDGAPFRVSGVLRPAGKDSDADLTVSLAPWNLPPTSSYGIQYAGYPVQRGKLQLDLKYKLAKRRVEASNIVTIHQLQLGDHVDSPTATGLPVKLALAILTDRQGKLTIDLPVEGNLDDPDFRVGKVILHAVLNVLEKAALAPFALLGSLFGSSEDMSAVDFAAGSDELADTEEKKLESLAKALAERPGLRLSIAGSMDPQIDRKGLLRSQLEEVLAAARHPPSGKLSPDHDEAPLGAPERATVLHALYQERVIAPREKQAAQLKAAGKSIPADLLPRPGATPDVEETALQDTLSISPDDLADLARSRAETIQQALIEDYGIEPDRVFLADKPAPSRKSQATLQLE